MRTWYFYLVVLLLAWAFEMKGMLRRLLLLFVCFDGCRGLEGYLMEGGDHKGTPYKSEGS